MLENVQDKIFKFPNGEKLWERCQWGKWHEKQAELHVFDKDLFLLWEKKDPTGWVIYVWNNFNEAPYRLMELRGRSGVEREWGEWVYQNLSTYRRRWEERERIGREKDLENSFKKADDLYADALYKLSFDNFYDQKQLGLYKMMDRYTKGEHALGIGTHRQEVGKEYGKNFDKIIVNDKRHKIDGRNNFDTQVLS